MTASKMKLSKYPCVHIHKCFVKKNMKIFLGIFFSLFVKAMQILRIFTEDAKKKPNIQRNVRHSEIRCWSEDPSCCFCKDYHCFTMRAIFLCYKLKTAIITLPT